MDTLSKSGIPKYNLCRYEVWLRTASLAFAHRLGRVKPHSIVGLHGGSWVGQLRFQLVKRNRA